MEAKERIEKDLENVFKLQESIVSEYGSVQELVRVAKFGTPEKKQLHHYLNSTRFLLHDLIYDNLYQYIVAHPESIVQTRNQLRAFEEDWEKQRVSLKYQGKRHNDHSLKSSDERNWSPYFNWEIYLGHYALRSAFGLYTVIKSLPLDRSVVVASGGIPAGALTTFFGMPTDIIDAHAPQEYNNLAAPVIQEVRVNKPFNSSDRVLLLEDCVENFVTYKLVQDHLTKQYGILKSQQEVFFMAGQVELGLSKTLSEDNLAHSKKVLEEGILFSEQLGLRHFDQALHRVHVLMSTDIEKTIVHYNQFTEKILGEYAKNVKI